MDKRNILDLKSEENLNFRIGQNCNSGGKKIKILITNPRHNRFVTGVSITLIPYIPQQYGGSQYFDKINLSKDFEETKSSLNFVIPAIPEYSYIVYGHFKADFGILSPSEERVQTLIFFTTIEGGLRYVLCYKILQGVSICSFVHSQTNIFRRSLFGSVRSSGSHSVCLSVCLSVRHQVV